MSELSAEYRQLELDSSNELIDHDAERRLGRYPQAALHAYRAGEERRKMGVLARDAGNVPQAIADWLSATACFVLATQPRWAVAGVAKVQELDHADLLPPERRDLREALTERGQEIKNLELRFEAFHEEYRRLFGAADTFSQEKLDYIRKHVRELPGYAKLHYAAYRQALALGYPAIATEHLRWAAEFDPDEPEYVGLYGYHLLASGQQNRATEMARWFLRKHPEEPTIRVLLAHSLIRFGENRGSEIAEATALLGEVAGDATAPVRVRLAAVALSGAVQRDQGNDVAARSLLSQFDALAATVSPTSSTVAWLRNLLTAPTNGREAGTAQRDQLLAEPIRSGLFSDAEELGLPSAGVGV